MIQRIVADTHGVRRFALGWSIEALRRDLDILREILVHAVRTHSRDTGGRSVDAVAVLFHLVDRAAVISRRAWQRAAHGPTGIPVEVDGTDVSYVADMAPPPNTCADHPE